MNVKLSTSSPSKRVKHALTSMKTDCVRPVVDGPVNETDSTEHQIIDSQISISSNLVVKPTEEFFDAQDGFKSSNDSAAASTTTNESSATQTEPDDIKTLLVMVGALTEEVKTMRTKMDIMHELQTNVNTLRVEFSSVKDNITGQIAELNSKVIINEEEISKLREQHKTNDQYIVSHVKPVVKKLEKGGLIDMMSKTLLEKITANEESIRGMKRPVESTAASVDMDKTLNMNLSDDEITTIAHHVLSLDGDDTPLGSVKSSVAEAKQRIMDISQKETESVQRFDAIEKQLITLKSMYDSLRQTPSKASNNNVINNNKSSSKPAENETLNHDVIIIGDSNTKKIDMGSIGRGTTRKRFTCYTIPQTVHFLNTANIVTPPKKVVFHLGTNDVKLGSSVQQLCEQYNHLIELARCKFPSARIYISSVFCRMSKTDRLNIVIAGLNEHLIKFCDGTPQYTLVDNSNIHHKDMKDPLHVNPTGFHTFICNLRVTVFGEKPNSRR